MKLFPKKLYSFFILLHGMALFGSGIAETVATGLIKGIVVDDQRRPLSGSSIILSELNTGTVADQEGRFVFEGLRDGYYTLHARHVGFSFASIQVKLEDALAEVRIVLTPTHIELLEVIVRENATGVVQAEQSLSVTVANRDFFAGSTSFTLLQSLQRIPGIQSMDIGTGVSKPVIRGLGFNRIVVAQNNIKQQGQQWGADHGLEIDMYGVERVEVVKGPASLMFGSDAIGGVINIRPPVISQENSIEGEITLAAQSNNDLLAASAMTAFSNNGRFFRLRLSHQDFADYRVPADRFVYNTRIIPIPGSRLKNTSGQDTGISMLAGIRKPWGMSTISVSNFNQRVGFFPASHGIPNPGSLAQAGDRRSPDYPLQKVNHFRAVSNTIWLQGNNRTELDIGLQQNHRQELNLPHVHGVGPLPEGDIELELVLNTFSMNVRHYRKVSENLSVLSGAATNYQDNKRGGYNFLLPSFRYGEAGIFGVIYYNFTERFHANAGLRIDGAFTDTEGFREPVWADSQTIAGYRERAPDLQRTFLNVAFSSGLSWFANDALNLKLNAGRSFRNPTPIELSANGVHHGSFRHEMGDSSLVAEHSWQLDAAVSYAVREFYFHASPFLNYFPNFLFLNPSGVFSPLPVAGQIYRFQQARALHMGGEIYTDWHITHALHTSLGAEYVWAQDMDEHFPLPFTPPPSFLAEVSYKFEMGTVSTGHIRLIASSRFVGSKHRTARNEPHTDGYSLLNAGVQLDLPFSGNRLNMIFMVNNLFDTLYKNHLSFYRILELPEPGRNFTLRVTVGLDRYLSSP